MDFKDLQKTLKEMEEAQGKHEQIIIEADKAQNKANQVIKEASKIQATILQEQDRVDSALEQLNTKNKQSDIDLNIREAAVNAKLADLETKTNSQAESFKQMKDDLVKRTVDVEKRETECREKEANLKSIADEYSTLGELLVKAKKI